MEKKSSFFTAGFKTDCQDLIRRILKHNSYDFKYFREEWMEMNFNYIFLNKHCMPSLIKFVEQALLIIKSLFLKSQFEIEKVHFFYLLYAVYFRQPPKEFCKIRITFDEWPLLLSFLKDVQTNAHCTQFKVIFWKLYIADAYRLVQDECERGLEFHLSKNKCEDKDTFESSKLTDYIAENLESLQNKPTAIPAALACLEKEYDKQKQLVNDNNNALIFSKLSIAEELNKNLSNILNVMKDEKTIKKVPISISTVTSEEPDIGERRNTLKNRAFGVSAPKHYSATDGDIELNRIGMVEESESETDNMQIDHEDMKEIGVEIVNPSAENVSRRSRVVTNKIDSRYIKNRKRTLAKMEITEDVFMEIENAMEEEDTSKDTPVESDILGALPDLVDE